LLARDDLRQVDQRITGRYHLAPLDVDEAAAYVRHRLRVAGARTEIFTPRALRILHRISGGFPRLINIIADRAMLAAYVRDRHQIDARLVRAAAAEVRGDFSEDRRPQWWWVLIAVTVFMTLLASAWVLLRR
jgi:general secretion pathway protein A